MALPKQVQAQLAEVEELEKVLAQNEGLEKTDESKLKVVEDTKDEVTKEQPKEALAPEEVKPADDTKDVTDDFKQKYSTLRGKYDAEVPRLHQQVRDLTDQLGSIRKDMDEAAKVKDETPKEKVSYVTDADREEYGDDLIDFQRRVAKEVSQDYEGRFEAQEKVIAELREQVSSTGNQIGEMGFAQKLNVLVPGFDQLDKDDRWVAWLNEYDPMSRGPRRDQAQSAFDRGDAESVAHYVKLFNESIAPAEQGKSVRQAELEKQVTPNRSANTSDTKSAAGSKIYSSKQMDNAWAKTRTLNTSGKYSEAAKLEAELTAAYMEGRVKN
ncbi:MAG: hypothetical protein HOE82_06635 [Gammaproteobacteria bacterium]|jgi:uncharacterized coiled-coil protein SlyX|nr:hypothetical protein [Gammaproteobacteria bacterium]